MAELGNSMHRRFYTWLLAITFLILASALVWVLANSRGKTTQTAAHVDAQKSAVNQSAKMAGIQPRPEAIRLLSQPGLLNSPVPTPTSQPVSNTNVPSRFAHRLSNTKESVGQLAHRDKAILLENALFDTEAPLPGIPAELQATDDPGTYIVQAKGPIDDSFRNLLRKAGATIISYVPNNAYLVRASASAIETLAAAAQVALPYEPYYKLKPGLLDLAITKKPMPDDSTLNVSLFADAREQTLDEFKKLGVTVVSEERSPFGPILHVRPQSDSLVPLARLQGVQAIEMARPRVHVNDLSRVRVGVSSNSVDDANYLDLTGQGTMVNVNDTGVDALHPDLAGRVFGDFATSLVDSNGHGTHVAGIIASSGEHSDSVTNAEGSVIPASGSHQFRGMAPKANIFAISTDVLFGAGTDSYLQETAAKTNAFISNNSWGYFNDTEYDLAAASYDAAVRDALPERTGSQPIVYVFAAGNSGGGNDQGTGGSADTISSPGTAKNVITVGAIEQFRNITNKTWIFHNINTGTNVTSVGFTNQPWMTMTDSSNHVASFSSRGNVAVGIEGDFGRFKPDVVAPGTFVVSTTEKAHWDQLAYYNPTNYHFDFIPDQIVATNTLEPYAIFVPDNAVQLIIRVFADVDLPIYVKQSSVPKTNSYDVLRTNIVAIPPDFSPLSPRDTFWNYAIGNPTSNEVSFAIETELVTTNDLGNYLEVLSNMNYTLGPYYRYESGTSMSAADISGMVALMQEYFEQRLSMTNSPALMKALLINGARPVDQRYDLQVNTSINYEGWGLASLPLSIPTNLDTQSTSMLFFDQSPTNALATNQKRTYTVEVDPAASGSPLRVTLVWTDPPGNPVTGIKLVNDLDLIVSNYDTGDIYYGNDILGGSDFNLPWDTNVVPNIDIVNNVENVFLMPPLGGKFDITVVGKRINVNAVTAQTNNVEQDYALVISCGDAEVPNALKLSGGNFVTRNIPNVLYLTNQFSSSPDVSGSLILGQRVGGNPTLIGTNTIPVPGSTNGLITLGVTNQWHFYVITNEQNYTNAAFVTLLPPTLSIPRMGVNENDVNNATRVEADIELYVSTDPDLTNLDASVISAADKSLGRGGTETIIYSNAQPGAVYYVGVKSEDHEASEYGFLGVFSLFPFGTQDGEGNWLIRGLNVPCIIPDGTPEHPGGANVIAVSPAPIQLRRVIVTNAITHENFGDLFGVLRHGQQFAVLNNHTFPPVTPMPITFTNIYEDNGQKDIQGSRHTDGPGSLRNFVGDYGFGPWILTEVDNAPNHTGRVDTLWIKLEKQNLTDGVNVTLQPNSWFYDFIDIPIEATNLTVCISQVDAATTFQPLELFLRRGDFPTFTDYDKRLTVNPPSGCLSISKYDLPPLRPGRYYIGVFNPNSTAQTFHIYARVDLDVAAIVPTKFTYIAPTPIADDAVTTSSLFVSNAQKIASVDVGVRIEHPRVSDLVLHLVSPSGKRVMLFENRGGTTTSGLGGGPLTTNVFPTTESGGPNADTNTLAVGQNNGILVIDYQFFTIPDDLRVYYDGARIFDSGLISGTGRFVIDFGPGASSSITIVMNEGGNSDTNTAWNYTATVVSGAFNYLTFTENTNLASIPIKFAPPPFATTVFGTNFLLSGFEPPQPGYYASPATVDGWNVLTSDEVTVINDPGGANTGQRYLSINQGQLGRTLPTTVGHNYTVRCVSRQPTNCITYSNFVSTADLNLLGNAGVVGSVLRLNPAAFSTGGNAWYRRKQQVTGGFDTRFQFQFTDFGALPGTPIGADGITFTIQNMGRNATGLCAPTTPNTHVSVFYNTFLNWPGCTDYRYCDYSDNSIGIVVNDVYIQQRDLYPMGINLKDGAVHSTHITYDGAVMNVWLDNAIVLTNVPVSLATGTDSCGMGWVGFTSGSGWAWENQDILNWTFCENAPTFGADMFIPRQATNSLSSTGNWVTNSMLFNAKQSGTPFDVFSQKCTSGLLLDTFTFSEAGGELYYFPEESLDSLVGDYAYGNWKLEIWDNVAGATNPPPQLLGWQLRFVFQDDKAAPIVLQHDIPATNTIPTNQIAYFVVDVPSWAKFATNILLSASSPVNLLFDQTIPPGTGGPDYTLLSASTGGTGVPVLSLTSTPPLVPGTRYYLGVQNVSAIPATVALKVDFDVTPLSNAIPVVGTLTAGPLPRFFSFDVSTNAVAATFQLTNLTGNVNLVARKGFPFPAPYDYDYGSFNSGISDEDIFVFTNSAPVPLSPGTWFLGVFNADIVPATYSIVATEYPYPFAGIITLTNALPYAGTNLLTPDTNDYYRFVVTTNAVRVQFEINGPSGDVTLVARKGLPVPYLSRYDYISANPRANDELIVIYDFSQPVPLTPGDWFLTAVNVSGAPVSYSILATEFPLYGTNIVITNSFVSTNSFCLTWTSVPGIHYYIQGKPDLLTTNWYVNSPTITAGGYLTTYCIPLPSTNYFFRVHEGIVLDDGTATPSVSIGSMALVGKGVLLRWNGPANARYGVEWSPSVTSTNWRPFYTSISSSNGAFYFFDDGSQTGGLDSARFYRLKKLP